MNNHVLAPTKDHQAVLCSLRKSRDNCKARVKCWIPFDYVDVEISHIINHCCLGN